MARADSPTHHEYRRAARRIRSIHRERPGALYRSLCDLSDRYDRSLARESKERVERAAMWPASAGSIQGGQAADPALRPRGVRLPISEAFARFVEERISGGVLRYSDRAELLEQAESLGMGRFQANLIVAAVLYQSSQQQVTTPSGSGWWGWGAAWLIVGLVQLMIVAAVWVLWIR